MLDPQPLENTSLYLKSLPILSDAVSERYTKAVRGVTNDGEIRRLRTQIQRELQNEWCEEKSPYIIVHFSDATGRCQMADCFTAVDGVYFEISNPVTNRGMMLPMPLAHNLIHHQLPSFVEPLMNLGNSPMGEVEQYLNVGGLLAILDNSNAPQEVLDELTEIRPMLDALEAERFAGVSMAESIPEDLFQQSDYERENAIVPVMKLLATMVDWGAEDIHIKAGLRPTGVVKGDVQPCPSFDNFLTSEVTKYYAYKLMTEQQQYQFEETREMDLSFYVPGCARFRCNVYWAQGVIGMVLRVIPTKIRPAEVLGVPAILKKLVFERMGLVLVTGQTGSGKTTTLAALLEFANQNRKVHILTLENPVEYVYENKGSIFTQRAIELDSLSFPMGMRAALREKPDIILIGEMRDPDTIMAGLKAAETGHLVLSTLHTNDAVQTISRLVNAFPPHEQETIRLQLATTIRACVSQRLVPRLDKPGRVCAIEVMLVTPNARGSNTREYIARNELAELYKVIATSAYDGMQSMNMALFEHYKNGVITGDDALAYSDNPEELIRWMRQLAQTGSKSF